MNQALNIAVIDRLAEEGFLTPAQASDFRESQAGSSVHGLLNILEKGAVPEKAFAEIVCALHGSEFLSADQLPTSAIEGTKPLSEFLLKHEALPLGLAEGKMRIAMSDPADSFVLKVLKAKLQCEIEPYIALRSDLLAALNKLYASNAEPSEATDFEVPADLDNESTLVREIHRLIQRAVSMGASDIHFEPTNQALRVRFRESGMLHEVHTFAPSQSAQVIARLKLMSQLDVSERRQPQNGRFKFPADGKMIDFRVSTLPLHDGESVVLRLLEARLSQSPLEDLGFREDVVQKLKEVVSAQQGLVLITGPTGSGKTTTMYSLLHRLNRSDLKLVSIEDPVELNIQGINQIQVDDQHGLSFADALRTVLRQDPDVIMVGEIRDTETAQLAAQAALTGHLVLSTLHTSSAAAAVTRLQNLGLPDYLIGATLRSVLAQRLIRCRCPNCGDQAATDVIRKKSPACVSCHGSSYVGRTSIAEYLELGNLSNASLAFGNLEEELAKYLSNGLTLRDDAEQKIAAGLSDRAELIRVLGLKS